MTLCKIPSQSQDGRYMSIGEAAVWVSAIVIGGAIVLLAMLIGALLAIPAVIRRIDSVIGDPWLCEPPEPVSISDEAGERLVRAMQDAKPEDFEIKAARQSCPTCGRWARCRR